MLIESLQGFSEEVQEDEDEQDSPIDLLRDMCMHLIQEEKHRYYQPEDWFQLINAIHQFLAKVSVKTVALQA